MEQINRTNQPQRSNSICGQEFYSNGGYQRLKHSVCNQTNLFDDHLSRFTQQRLQSLQSGYKQPQLHLNPQGSIARSPSPINNSSLTHCRDGSQLHSLQDSRRSKIHASLECLNSALADHQHSSSLQRQAPNHNIIPLNQQHYAATYVLAQPPANTVINQSGDRDLAAAAMGAPSHYQQQQQQQYQHQQIPSNSYSGQAQALLNRALAQVPHSPYRRMTSSYLTSSSPQNPSIQPTAANLPMRAGHSSLSLTSSSYILEDKLQNEIRKLQGELKSEKEKNEALNSQLNINSSLMSAFEQSLTTLNSRLRQLTASSEKKDEEISDLRKELQAISLLPDRDGATSKSPTDDTLNDSSEEQRSRTDSEKDSDIERNLTKTIEDLKRQLIEKDRLLTDTRLEALSAAHQLEQLESKLNGEHSLLMNDDDLDEGVNLINHSPSESDATTDSAHFSEMNNQLLRSNGICQTEVQHPQPRS